MDQIDLFEEPQPQAFSLPALDYRPIRTAIGQVRAQLRPAANVDMMPVGKVAISQRTLAPVYQVPGGERFVVVHRKTVARPDGVDGVLFRQEGGALKWVSHRAIDDLERTAVEQGWQAVIAAHACSSWDGKFRFRAEVANADGSVDPGNEGLRPPQVGALHAIGAHWSLYHQPATIVMPTGTGKTETMLSVLAAYARKPVLVVVPSDALRAQTVRKFLTMGLLRQLGVLAPEAGNPIVGIVNKVPKSLADLEIFERCNVIVGTMSSLAGPGADALGPEIARRVGALIVDEAHHVGADTWSAFREAFADNRVLQFTATPFRRDGKLIDGQVVYNYPLKRAQADGYFKPITFDPVYEPSAEHADAAIAETAIAQLRKDLGAGHNHLMMARCAKIERATAVFDLYRRLAPDLNPILVHSRQPDIARRIEDLRAGVNRIAVCVNMLGEGFDLPELKVAAIHDLHKSLAVLLQFTGRFTRSAGDRIGDASVIANIAEPNVSAALERLYSEDADWNVLLSEMSSAAAKEHARLVAFLDEAQRLDKGPDDDTAAISHQLLRPGLSTLTFEAKAFAPKRFHEGLPEGYVPYRVWLHAKSNTLFFVTRCEPYVRWTRSKSVRDLQWAIFVLHYDEANGLLFLSTSDKSSTFEGLARAVGATRLINGDTIFRSLGNITRLQFQNVGVKKHGRRNLSYAMYTGADVAAALGLTEKGNSVKANLSGMGWEGGRQILIGCSLKGRIWSRDYVPIPQLNDWCEHVGAKLIDVSIDTSKLIDNVLIPSEVTALPGAEVLAIDWPFEMLRQTEERIVFTAGIVQCAMTTAELTLIDVVRAGNAIDFALDEASAGRIGEFRFSIDAARGFRVVQTSGGAKAGLTIGKLSCPLEDYFSSYPPIFRLVDLTDLDGNLHIAPQSPQDLVISEDRFEAWEWEGVDRTKESYWKGGVGREDSVQWHVAKQYVDAGFDIVFDDDDAGEAADLVCMKIEEDAIRVALVHCKYSGGKTAGERVKDVVEVSSQAVRCAKWSAKLPQLSQHLKVRNDRLKGTRDSRFIQGTASELNNIVKLNRFKPMQTEILIVQPGLSQSKRTKEQSAVLAAALTYLKETIGVDVTIVCDA